MKIIDQHMDEETKVKKASKINNIIERLRSNGGTHGPTIWKKRDEIRGKKQESRTAILYDQGNLIEEKGQILIRYKQYFQNLLTLTKP